MPGFEASREPAPDGQQLWLHLHLPRLPLEVLTRGIEISRACVLVEPEQARPKVLLSNHQAAALGIRSGMPLGAAHALGAIEVLERHALREARALQDLCAWAMQFTPFVSAVPPDGLVLEIRGSLKLFGGLEGLLQRVRQALRKLGYRADYAVAPTPLGAAVLARAQPRTVVTEPRRLGVALAELTLDALRLDTVHRDKLEQVGIRTLADCRRLPRAGLARRFSPGFVRLLDQLHGQAPDPRAPVILPQYFESAIELPWEVGNSRGLMQGAERLLHELEAFLVASVAETPRLQWTLVDRDGGRESFDLGFASPVNDVERMLLLLRETLGRKRLRVPVRRIELRVKDIERRTPVMAGDLFEARKVHDEQAGAVFIDRLRARFGDEALRALEVNDEHRPEQAHAWRRPVLTRSHSNVGLCRARQRRVERPVWLLDQPVRLESRQGAPNFDGPLQLVADRERIQQGWWDEARQARDYFTATTRRGQRLWVYRELDGERAWYLHGIFG